MPTTRSAARKDVTATPSNKSKKGGGIVKNNVAKVKPKNPRLPPGREGKTATAPSPQVVEKDQTTREEEIIKDNPKSASKIPLPVRAAIRTPAAQKATPSSATNKQKFTRAAVDNDTPSSSTVGRRLQSSRIQMLSKSKQEKPATPADSSKSRREKDKILPHVVNSWTPTLERRRKAAVECRIVDPLHTFPGSLDWKMRNYGMPVTSTPQPSHPTKASATAASTAVTNKDLENCFGFDDDSVEDNYSDLISPIAMVPKPRRFPLLVKNLSRPVIDPVTNAPSTSSNSSTKVLQENNSSEDGLKNVPSTSAPNQNNFVKSSIAEPKNKKDGTKSHKTKKQTQSKSTKKIEVENAGKQKRCSADLYEFDDVQSSQTLADEVSSMDDNAESSTLCQGILRTEKEGDEDFNALLHKYGKGNADDDGEIHFDSGKLKRTYHHTKHREIPVLKRQKQQSSNRKSKKKSCGTTSSRANEGHPVLSDSDDSDLDPIIKQWLEKKNKEFDEVLHIPLLIKRINADTIGDGDSQ